MKRRISNASLRAGYFTAAKTSAALAGLAVLFFSRSTFAFGRRKKALP